MSLTKLQIVLRSFISKIELLAQGKFAGQKVMTVGILGAWAGGLLALLGKMTRDFNGDSILWIVGELVLLLGWTVIVTGVATTAIGIVLIWRSLLLGRPKS